MTNPDLFGAPSTLLPPGETPRGRWEWPELPHPETGVVQLWRRPSKISEPLEDDFSLQKWKQRAVAKGMAHREDLRALAYACDFTDPSDIKILNDVAWKAQQAAGTSNRANIGTARHKLFDAYDRTGTVPPASEAAMHLDVMAYAAACADYGLRMAPELIERSGVTIADGVDAAGQWDRILWQPEWPLPRIGDAKTGDDVLKYHQLAYAAQMACYSRACVMLPRQWDTARGADQYEPMVAVDQDWGLVIHVAAGSGEVTFIDVDLRAGWEAVLLAKTVSEWRKRGDLLIPVRTWRRAEPDAPATDAVEALSATAREIAAEALAGPAPTTTADGKLDMATASPEQVHDYIGEGIAPAPAPAKTPRKRAPRKPPARAEIAETATGVLADLHAMHVARAADGVPPVVLFEPTAPAGDVLTSDPELDARPRDTTPIPPDLDDSAIGPDLFVVTGVQCAHGTPCGPCQGLPVTEWTLEEKVREAPTVEVLSALWQANTAEWTDELTALGTARAEALSAPK